MKAVVVGAGLGGCATAIGLRAVGVDVHVVEAAPAMRREGESISLLANGTISSLPVQPMAIRPQPGTGRERSWSG